MEKKTQLVHLKDGTSLLVPFILITSLFFLWGFAHSILDVLNKHFQDALGITKAKSALVQAVVYGGYFLMALPAGAIIRRWGYRTGVLTGLLLYGIGALLFIPGGLRTDLPGNSRQSVCHGTGRTGRSRTAYQPGTGFQRAGMDLRPAGRRIFSLCRKRKKQYQSALCHHRCSGTAGSSGFLTHQTAGNKSTDRKLSEEKRDTGNSPD